MIFPKKLHQQVKFMEYAVQYLEINAEYAGQRLDNFLAHHWQGVPRSHRYRRVRRGEVRVNHGRVGPEYRVQTGDIVRLPPIRQAAPQAPAHPGAPLLELLQTRIIHEDAGLLVLNKPAGLAVHGGSGISYGVIEAFRALRSNEPGLELIHRLDRETSGLLLIAKRRAVLRHIQELLRTGAVAKRYLALVRGSWAEKFRRVDAPLIKNHLQSGERIVRVDSTGKAAVTEFRVIARHPEASLVEAHPLTGRTHQIRVHAAHCGHPLAGDDKYGDADFNHRARSWGLRRLFLHAHSLRFEYDGQELIFEAPLDPDLITPSRYL